MNCAHHPDRERVSFCQNCGKPLCAECVRTVGAGAFCEPCLAARLAAANAASPNFATVPMPVIPPVPGAPNPLLAGALGLIPGVGAMYNEQYAKGVVHLVIFVVLVSLADSYGAVGILVAGWIFYQAFEAYHTARARRDGTPLPNPFGLNDIGERFGFGKAWPATAPVASSPAPGASSLAPVASPAAASTGTPAAPYTPPSAPHFVQTPGNPVYGGATWGAPRETYAPMPPFPDPYAAAYSTPLPDPQLGRSRFPAGAIWLIVLGLLFFFGSSGWFRHFPIERVIPFIVIGLGVWLFVRKMTNSGQALTDDGSPAYRLRLFSALRAPVWVVLIGLLFFLDTFYLL